MPRIYTRIGDIFSVELHQNSWKYFQYISHDLTQLNSDVIRVFETAYHDIPEMDTIISDKIQFYAHCVVNLGVKLNYWKKVGHSDNVGSLNIHFRGSEDVGEITENSPVTVSKNWYVWKINEKIRKVGVLQGDLQKLDIGSVMPANEIAEKIKNGEYSYFYPGY